MKIVSGGQTGVDRAALDVALELGLPCGGWCPRGRRAEDGVVPAVYPLRESPVAAYRDRTGRNVRDSGATLILNRGRLEGGTRLTVDIARALGRPCLVVDLDRPPPPQRVAAWLDTHAVKVLNVAGPRESGRPGIHGLAAGFLRRLLAAMEP